MFDQLIFNALLSTLQADAVDRRMVGRLIDQIENFGASLEAMVHQPTYYTNNNNNKESYNMSRSAHEQKRMHYLRASKNPME